MFAAFSGNLNNAPTQAQGNILVLIQDGRSENVAHA